jgi:hypothetical protein
MVEIGHVTLLQENPCHLSQKGTSATWKGDDFSVFSEFPNGLRYLCTTMPWTIWPALVVLWGVCWIFQPSNNRAQEEPTPLVQGNAPSWTVSPDLGPDLGYEAFSRHISSL